MKYPKYIPEIVQNHFDNFLFHETHGYQILLKKLTNQLSSYTKAIKNDKSQDLGSKIFHLMRDKEVLQSQIIAMKKLITDKRMEEIYKQLEKNIETKYLPSFVRICWSCVPGFENERGKRYLASQCAQKISSIAKSLANEMQKLDQLGFPISTCLHSIPSLLKETTNEYDNDFWISTKESLLNDNDWCFSPPTEAMLITLSEKAADMTFKLPESPQEAAIKSRQKNKKQEYLRALLYLAITEYKIPPSNELLKIICSIGEIVLEEDEIRIQDCQNALNLLGTTETA